MKFLFLTFFFISNLAWGQFSQSWTFTENLSVTNEDEARKELVFMAAMKSFEKLAPEMGYKTEEFQEKLKSKFSEYLIHFRQRKLAEKFGAQFNSNLGEPEKAAFLSSLVTEEHHQFIRFSRVLTAVKSHTFSNLMKDQTSPNRWTAKIDLELEKSKVDKVLRKIIFDEKKRYSKILIVLDVDLVQLTWEELSLDSQAVFVKPIFESWLKWFLENQPSTVEEVIVCSQDCQKFYNKWIETEVGQISIPEDFLDSVLLKLDFNLKKSASSDLLKELRFDWEGRAVLLDVNTKRVLQSYSLAPEFRVFKQADSKTINSTLASSIYRSPLTAFMQFSKKLEEKRDIARAKKLVLSGYQHLGDVLGFMDLLKTRGASLGMDVELESFTKDDVHLVCFYQGEEKSFTDLLSGIKELKSSHHYSLVDEFTGLHFTVKFVKE